MNSPRVLSFLTIVAVGCNSAAMTQSPVYEPAVPSGSGVRPQPGLARMSEECEAGEKRACYLLARAYQKGEAPVTAETEIVVQDPARAAYY